MKEDNVLTLDELKTKYIDGWIHDSIEQEEHMLDDVVKYVMSKYPLTRGHVEAIDEHLIDKFYNNRKMYFDLLDWAANMVVDILFNYDVED